MADITLRNIRVVHNQRAILNISNQKIHCHSITGVIGANGSGKTTLLKVIAGLIHQPNFDLVNPYKEIFMVLHQTPLIKMSVYHNLRLLKDVYPSLTNDRIEQVMQEFQLDHLNQQPATKLSAGEKQRLALARACLMDAKLVLLDEPTASLDPASTLLIESKIVELSNTGINFLIASHDFAQVKRVCHDVVFIADGQIQEQSPTKLFFTSPQTPAAQHFIARHI
jgi:tungstate transport system ATP-binding protein